MLRLLAKKGAMMKTIFAILPLCLLGCSQPTPTNSQANALPKSEVKNEILPKPLTSNSYVLAEPLAGKKVKISITAKDKSLFIVNCNEHIMNAIYDTQKPNALTQMTSDACRSDDVAIPAYATLSFVSDYSNSYDVDGKKIVLPTDKTYYVKVANINQKDKNYRNVPLSETDITSNEFQLLP